MIEMHGLLILLCWLIVNKTELDTHPARQNYLKMKSVFQLDGLKSVLSVEGTLDLF